MSFRTRFAPSPTGYLHVGGARTALYCWLQAKKQQGTYILRIEDTDRERSTDTAVNAILESLNWLGLSADEGPVYQTERFGRYHDAIHQLVEQGDAYRCYCTRETLDEMREAQRIAGEKPRYDGRCRDRQDQPKDTPFVIRFKTPKSGVTRFDDLVRGELVFENNELDDLIIQRSDQTPTYNFCVVVDDADMEITHVIRGDDHINNTPRQINIFKALDYPLPQFAHVPMILGEDGSRLSKRHGAVGVMEYEKQGFLPSALLNYLIRLGWSHGDQEIFTLDEMIELFDIKDVNRAASSFNLDKLRWLNQQHMQATKPGELAKLVAQELHRRDLCCSAGPDLEAVSIVFRDRAHTIVELVDSCEYLFKDFENYDDGAARKHLRPVVLEPLTELHSKFNDLKTWKEESIETVIDQVLSQFELKLPKLALPLRVAVTGAAMSPSIGTTLELLGQAKTLERMASALEFIARRKAGS